LILSNCQEKNPLEADDRVFSAEDRHAIEKMREAYTQSWKDNDATTLLSLFWEDATIIPHHGDQPIQGKDQIRDFWFPQGAPPTQIQTFTSDIQQVDGDNQWAYIRGRQKLAFAYKGKSYRNEGNFVGVLRRKEGSWKFQVLIWNDPPFEIE
ncbi:MAG: nuclear transport factor 2 family protein, partial [Bacteroidota bacterium]